MLERIAGVVLLAALVGEGWLIWQMLRQQGRLLLRLEAVEAKEAVLPLAPQPEDAVPAGLKIGTPAPAFSLPDLEGNLIRLSDFRGRSTLVLFWRPSCDFCRHMLADLKAWEAQRLEDALTLVVVSSESVADNQAMGLRSPVVLDHTAMSVGSQFGAAGTPMAVLVDEEGKIASALAAGAQAVLALAWSYQDSHAPVEV